MSMYNGHTRNKHSSIPSVHSPSYINIFRIHEEPFIKQSYFFETFQTKKHETTLMIGHIHFFLMVIEF